MTKRRQFWLSVVVGIQFLIIVFFLSGVLLPNPGGDAFEPAVYLKKIHDLAVQARTQGRIFSKADVEKTIAQMREDSLRFVNTEVLGTDSHWTVLFAVPRDHPTKLGRLLNVAGREWPVYVLTSDDEGFIRVSAYGQIIHYDFNW